MSYNELKGYSLEQLQAEIERKKIVSATRPVPKAEFNKLPTLKVVLENMIQEIINGESDARDESERMQLVYESVMAEAFGPDIQVWIDENC